MVDNVMIRPLELDDHKISYAWRNDPAIWQFTGSKPNRTITPEIEKEWLAGAIQRPNEKRFAICVGPKKRYVGNVQLTSIGNEEAEYHIFIGEKEYWGKGIAKKASILILEYAFKVLKLTQVFLYVNHDNVTALRMYEKLSFKVVENKNSSIKMLLKNV